ncbi:MAG: hypothetical protein KME21_16035 [Desmonostoc vinosum HA7617-LM4]|jgi:hypothetical protein|nr:hypothetical protein [Desmonostoc vinosum HA7617-LM4]
MNKNFLDVAKTGKNDWWRYLLGVLLIIFFYWEIGSFVSGIVATIFFLASNTANGVDIYSLGAELQQQLEFYLKNSPSRTFVISNIPFFLPV